MKNKGFSLVELIIVIAIMAILAAAIAPALIRYIDKSRRSDDVAAAETLNTAAQAALSNEDAYDEVQTYMGSGDVCLATATPGGQFTSSLTSISGGSFLYEINSSCSQKAPKLKFKKDHNGTGTKAVKWAIGVSDDGKPIVWLGTASDDTKYEMQPDICKEYK
ncbi:MAG: prepilin-type N-terminal cleavage/methylation domain-containing protein [Eubacterium sp.]|nr:prepilin-type N-terminal cleavage/methylation domain-containing protein [Eubacterium sp.]